jgi:hypothetical protein
MQHYRREDDEILIRWSEVVRQEIDANNLGPSILHRIITLGPVGASIHATSPHIPRYWPTQAIRLVNAYIQSITVRDRNILVSRYVLHSSLAEISRSIDLDKWHIRNRLDTLTRRANKYLQANQSNQSTT